MNCIMPSSVVNHFIYFPETEILRIIYQSGAVYDYLKVSADIVEKFEKARSKGQFLNKVIKPRFKYIKIE
ncbi:KTSC domain-containing protein [Chryseobacterium gleum]|uniref:KTSC domain-containing protein n=1 Tax=Chryseobacterium gleum TaxID=250 RepID=UPI0031D438AC